MNEGIYVDMLLYEYGFTYEEVNLIIRDKSFFKYDDSKLGMMVLRNYKYLLDKGYSLDEIKRMALGYPGSLCVSDNKRQIIENIFLELGMSYNDFKKIVICYGNVWSYSKDRICSYIEFFRNLGYSNEDIVNIFRKAALILRSSVDNFKKLYNFMIDYGFSKEDIFVIGKNFPGFWSHTFSKVVSIINVFILYGFTSQEAINILVKSPSLLGYGDGTIKDKFDKLFILGFTKEEIINIINIYPSIINCDIDRTSAILDFFTNIGLRNKAIEYPHYFFKQGIESSYARYCFYMDNNIDINEDTFRRLFVGWKYFEKTFKVSKLELLDKYKYEDSKCKKKIKYLG